MSCHHISDVVFRAEGLEPGKVLPEEVEFARNILRSRKGDIVAAILVVGLCGNAGDASLLEDFLHGDRNNIFVEYSLKALCRYLGLIDHYRPLVRNWMQLPNEEAAFRRMSAIHLAKEYFTEFKDDPLGRYLIDVLCDFSDDCRGSVRSVFVDILELRTKLKDPFGLDFEEWDDDTTFIVELAAKKFSYKGWRIKHGSKVH